MNELLNESQALWVKETLDKIEKKMAVSARRSADKIPSQAIDGVNNNKAYNDVSEPHDGIGWWTNGFWGGILWQMYQYTGDEFYKETAQQNEVMLDDALETFLGMHHDVGFMWLPTSVASYRITKDPISYRRALHAATILAGRYNPTGFIRAWNGPGTGPEVKTGWAIIDCMFNIPILHWAATALKDPRFSKIANHHADTVIREFIRPDGSVRHIVEFDPDTGVYVDDFGGQGMEKGSSWTRGQTWGLYGMLINFKNTGKTPYLAAAQKIAEYFIANIPENGQIPVDFCQPKDVLWYDDIAAACAAGALIELAKEVPIKAKEYMDAAIKMLKNIDDTSDWNLETDGITQNCSCSYSAKLHNENYTYGDYYFIEAMLKLNGTEFPVWMDFDKI